MLHSVYAIIGHVWYTWSMQRSYPPSRCMYPICGHMRWRIHVHVLVLFRPAHYPLLAPGDTMRKTGIRDINSRYQRPLNIARIIGPVRSSSSYIERDKLLSSLMYKSSIYAYFLWTDTTSANCRCWKYILQVQWEINEDRSVYIYINIDMSKILWVLLEFIFNM